MSTEAQLKAISNSELASGNQIPALKHRTVNNAIIEEMYDAQSRGDVLAGVQSAVSIASGDQVLVIRSGQAYLLDADEFGFVDALADLTDVNIPTPANDQVLAYNTSTSKWVAKDVNTLTSVVSISGTATTNALTKFTGTSSIGNSILSDNGTTVTIGGNLNVDSNLTVGTINSGTSSDFVKGDGSLDSTTYQDTSEKGQANGYAPLDSGAKVAEAYLPDSILGQVSYQGTWDASTNTPTLANPPASTTKGEYYVTSVAGTQFSIDFQVGDWIISNGSAWEKVDNTDAVTSVFGRLGNVVPNKIDYISFYVSLDTTQTITGQKTFNGDALRIAADGTANVLRFRNTSGSSVAGVGVNIIGMNGSNDLFLSKSTSNIGVFSFSNTAARTYTFPDTTGTVALTSDLDDTLDSVTDRGATTTNAITVGGATINGFTHISASSSLATLISNSDSTNGFGLKITAGGSATSRYALHVLDSADTDSFFIVSTESGKRGFVGIGTSSPSAKLHIVTATGVNFQDAIYLSKAGGFGDSIIQNYYNNVTHYGIAFEVGGVKGLHQNSLGNVGIGTSSPVASLHVANPNNATIPVFIESNMDARGLDIGSRTGSDFANITFTSDDGATPLAAIGSVGDSFRIFTGGNTSERMRIDSSGNVGIGTSSPNTNLSILGGTSSAINNSTKGIWIQNGGSNYSGISFSDTTSRTNSSAFIGMLGTNSGGAGNGALVFATRNTLGDDPATERMRIDSSGNVGIGTSSPSFQLQLSTDSAAKPTSALWTIASDARIKENIEPYTKGLDELMLINPITYDYNGLGGYEKGKGGVGIIAQEIKDVLPDSVSSVKAKLNEDDEEETDILNFNGHELTYVLINSIKELRAEIETLKQQINGQ